MARAREDLRVAQAKLEQYAQATEESTAALRAKVEALRKEDAALSGELSALREREKALAVRVGLRAEQDKLTVRMAALEEQKASVRALSEELDRLGKASAVVRDYQEAQKRKDRIQVCAHNLSVAQTSASEAQNALDAELVWDASKAETEEQALTERVAQAKSAELYAAEQKRRRRSCRKSRRNLRGSARHSLIFPMKKSVRR